MKRKLVLLLSFMLLTGCADSTDISAEVTAPTTIEAAENEVQDISAATVTTTTVNSTVSTTTSAVEITSEVPEEIPVCETLLTPVENIGVYTGMPITSEGIEGIMIETDYPDKEHIRRVKEYVWNDEAVREDLTSWNWEYSEREYGISAPACADDLIFNSGVYADFDNDGVNESIIGLNLSYDIVYGCLAMFYCDETGVYDLGFQSNIYPAYTKITNNDYEYWLITATAGAGNHQSKVYSFRDGAPVEMFKGDGNGRIIYCYDRFLLECPKYPWNAFPAIITADGSIKRLAVEPIDEQCFYAHINNGRELISALNNNGFIVKRIYTAGFYSFWIESEDGECCYFDFYFYNLIKRGESYNIKVDSQFYGILPEINADNTVKGVDLFGKIPDSSTAAKTTTATDTTTASAEPSYSPIIDLSGYDIVKKYDSSGFLPLIEIWQDKLSEVCFDEQKEIFCCQLGDHVLMYTGYYFVQNPAAVIMSEDSFAVLEGDFYYGIPYFFVHGDSLFVYDHYLQNGISHNTFDEYSLQSGEKLSSYCEYYDIGCEITEPNGEGYNTDHASFEDVSAAMQGMTDTLCDADIIENPVYEPCFMGFDHEMLYLKDAVADHGLRYELAYIKASENPRYSTEYQGNSTNGNGGPEWNTVRKGDTLGGLAVTSAKCRYLENGELFQQEILLSGEITLSGRLIYSPEEMLLDHNVIFLPDVDDFKASGLPVTEEAKIVFIDGMRTACVDIPVFGLGIYSSHPQDFEGVSFDESGIAEVAMTLENLRYFYSYGDRTGTGFNSADIVSVTQK